MHRNKRTHQDLSEVPVQKTQSIPVLQTTWKAVCELTYTSLRSFKIIQQRTTAISFLFSS
nr:MAG TPA: hypothetical protein [Bacteriophage sp.]